MVEKLRSVADLEQLYQLAGTKQAQREAKTQVKVHLGSCGIASGADKVLKAFEQELVVLQSHTNDGETDIQTG